MEQSKIGAIYVATGKKEQLQEAIRSVNLLRHHNRNLKTAIVTEMEVEAKSFDYIIPPKYLELNGTMASKIQALELSPFKITLILDNDTLVVDNIMAGFNFVKRGKRDIAISIADKQEMPNDSGITKFQNGLMFIWKCERVLDLFRKWQELVINNNPNSPTRFIFSKLLADFSEISIYPLSYFWNLRIDLIQDLSIVPLKKIIPKVRIFHSHLKRPKAIEIFKMHPRWKEICKVGEIEL